MTKVLLPPKNQKPLESIKSLFIWLNLYPDESRTKKEKITHFVIFVLCYMITIAHMMYFFYFFIQNLHTDLTGSLMALLGVTGLSTIVYMIIAGFIIRTELCEVIDELAVIYSDNREADSFNILIDVNRKSERMGIVYRKAIVYAVTPFILLPVSSVLYCWCMAGSFNGDNAFHPIKLITPWDQTTLLGYSMEMCSAVIAGIVFLVAHGAFSLLFVSMCIHHQAFYQMLEHSIDKIKSGERQCDEQFLCDLIRFHTSVKSWFLKSVNVYSVIVLVLMICSVIDVAICVFSLDLQTDNVHLDLVTFLWALIINTTNLFIYCYFGDLATESFIKMSDSLNDINWVEMPVKFQKYLVIITANMQKPIHYHGFYIFELNLNTFITFVRMVYNYYMIFKTLTSNQM